MYYIVCNFEVLTPDMSSNAVRQATHCAMMVLQSTDSVQATAHTHPVVDLEEVLGYAYSTAVAVSQPTCLMNRPAD